MQKRSYSKFYILGSLMAAIILLIFLNSLGWMKAPKDILYSAVTPIFKPFEFLGAQISGSLNFLGEMKNLVNENSVLKKENENLKLKLAELGEVAEQNKILRQQLSVSPSLKTKMVMADLIGFDPGGLGEYFLINRGKKDGVSDGQAVIFSGGFLIGKIIEVQNSSSKVLALTDSGSSVFSLSQETRIGGVVRGDHGVGIFLDMVPPEKDINDGETIISSGLDSKIPEGLIIGQVESRISSESDVFQRYKVKPAINSKDINSVFVVLGNE